MEAKDIKSASKIYYSLLKNGEIKKSTNRDLFNLYNSSVEIQEILSCMLEESKSDILVTTESIYLIPKPENDIIGFNYRNDDEFKSIDEQMDYYISLYIMTFIFNEFYNKVAPVEFVSVDQLVKRIGSRLDIAAAKENINEIQNTVKYNITALRDAWKAKSDVPENKNEAEGKLTKAYKYRYGCVRKTIIFLENQGLIQYHKEDDEIRTRQKLDDLMNKYFLDNERRCQIEAILFDNI